MRRHPDGTSGCLASQHEDSFAQANRPGFGCGESCYWRTFLAEVLPWFFTLALIFTLQVSFEGM